LAGFMLSEWERFDSGLLWRGVCESLGCQRLGKKAKIPREDEMRRPGVKLLRGEDPWVTAVDNGIRCSWDVTRCMFSSGNGTEKKRVAQFHSRYPLPTSFLPPALGIMSNPLTPNNNNRDMVVVDLYAGIGYFTLPYLIHGGAKFVHACEWNPDAVEALRRNLRDNVINSFLFLILFFTPINAFITHPPFLESRGPRSGV